MNRLKLTFALLLCISLFQTSHKICEAWYFGAIGDTRPGSAYDHAQNMSAMAQKVPSGLVTVFNVGDLTLDGIDTQWQTFRNIISVIGVPAADNSPTSLAWWYNGVIGGIPKYLSGVGNHDIHNTGWETRWQTYLPAQAGLSAYSDIPANPQGLFGSAKYDNAIFIWLNDQTTTPNQTTFLDNTLKRAKADPSVTWKFVSFHQPPVSCGGSHGDSSNGKTWHDTYFYPNGVDIVFVGDNHYYERTCPFGAGLASSGTNEGSICDPSNTTNLLVNPKGPIHNIIGNGGASIYTTSICNWMGKKSDGTDAKAEVHGFSIFEINGNVLHSVSYDTDTNIGTAATLTAAQVNSLLKTDEFTITKTTANIYDYDADGDVDFNDLLKHLSLWISGKTVLDYNRFIKAFTQ